MVTQWKAKFRDASMFHSLCSLLLHCEVTKVELRGGMHAGCGGRVYIIDRMCPLRPSSPCDNHIWTS